MEAMGDDYYRVSPEALARCQDEVLQRAWQALLDAGAIRFPDGAPVVGWTATATREGVKLSHGGATHVVEHDAGHPVAPVAHALAAVLSRAHPPVHRFPKQP
jgi:hypothetical protein